MDQSNDLDAVHNLWNETMDLASRYPVQHILHPYSTDRIRSSLYNPRPIQLRWRANPRFAATYLTYIDQEGEKLLGSLAILLVNPTYRNKGIGSALHSYALSQLKDTTGVRRLQLGSLWPRILFGPLCGPHTRDAMVAKKAMEEEERIACWFRKRGWSIASIHPLNKSQVVAPGQGKAVHDLILPFTDWKPIITTPTSSTPASRRTSASPKAKKQKVAASPPTAEDKILNEKAEKLRLMKSQITFRPCTQVDMASVLGLVDDAADVEGDNLGWYDQYSRLSNEIYVKDIVVATINTSASSTLLNPPGTKGRGMGGKKNGMGDGVGVERTRLVGCALTYTPASGNPVAGDLPWAGVGGEGVGPDVGGVCCVCVSSTVDRESLMIGLLDACVQNLREQGMKKLFLDTVRNHLEWFEELGFIEWARYRDVWRDIEPAESEDDADNEGGGDQDVDM